MNFAIHISCLVEEKLALIQRLADWTEADETQAYEQCFKKALEENGQAWADGNIRIGDYILLGEFSCPILCCCIFFYTQRDPGIAHLQELITI
jgi:hypothetical protein